MSSPERVTFPDFVLYRRDGSSAWWYDFTVSGQRERWSCGTGDRAGAERIAREAREKAIRAAGRPGRGKGVDLALLGGLDYERAQKKGVSAAQQKSVLDLWRSICETLGSSLEASAVDYELAEDYIARRRAAGRLGKTIRLELQALKRGLRIAARKKLIDVAPSDWPQIRSDPPGKRRGKVHPIPVILRWLEALDQVPRSAGARAQAELVIRTGLRAHEVRALTWAWVEPGLVGVLEEADPSIVATLRPPAEACKDREERVIGLTAETLTLLEAARRERGWDAPLFPGVHLRAFTAARKLIGYAKTITLRDLRHMHGTLAAWLTKDARAAQAALGHSSLETTQLYLSSSLERTTAAAAAVGQALARHNPASQVAADPPKSLDKGGRGERIRTSDFLVPNQFSDFLDHVNTCDHCRSRLIAAVAALLDDGGCRHSDGHRRTG